MQKEWEDQLKDPDDVLFAAKSRKEEIREQMKDLQHGLDRAKPKKKKARSVRKRRTPGADRYAAAENPQRPFRYCDCCVHPATSRHAYSPSTQHNGCGGPQL
jgi:hypothetical protein